MKKIIFIIGLGAVVFFLLPFLNKEPLTDLYKDKQTEVGKEVIEYKTETHLHSKESNYDGKVSVGNIINLYKEKGYSTIIETPHVSERHFTRVGIEWNEFIDYLYSSYNIAKYIEGFNYLFAIELTLTSNNNDYLIYGVTEEFLKENEFLYNISLSELVNLCTKNNFLIVQPHPFRDGYEIDSVEYKMPFERYNGQYSAENHNDLAEEYFQENNLTGLSGSDFHEISDLARGGIITTKEILTINDYIEVVLKNDFTIIRSEED